MCLSRAVGCRVMPRASTTSWPCAQYSMSRAVANDSGLIGGPYQGTFVPGGSCAKAFTIWSKPSCHRSTSSSLVSPWPASSQLAMKPSGSAKTCGSSALKASGSAAAIVPLASPTIRWLAVSRTSHRSRRHGRVQVGSAHDVDQGVVLGSQVVQQLVQHASRLVRM